MKPSLFCRLIPPRATSLLTLLQICRQNIRMDTMKLFSFDSLHTNCMAGLSSYSIANQDISVVKTLQWTYNETFLIPPRATSLLTLLQILIFLSSQLYRYKKYFLSFDLRLFWIRIAWLARNSTNWTNSFCTHKGVRFAEKEFARNQNSGLPACGSNQVIISRP